MKERKPIILLSLNKVFVEFGVNIKLARLRRKLSTEQVAKRAVISRATLWHIEKGAPSVAMGIYGQVLYVLGLDKYLLKVADDDILERKLQDAELIVKKMAPKKKKDE